MAEPAVELDEHALRLVGDVVHPEAPQLTKVGALTSTQRVGRGVAPMSPEEPHLHRRSRPCVATSRRAHRSRRPRSRSGARAGRQAARGSSAASLVRLARECAGRGGPAASLVPSSGRPDRAGSRLPSTRHGQCRSVDEAGRHRSDDGSHGTRAAFATRRRSSIEPASMDRGRWLSRPWTKPAVLVRPRRARRRPSRAAERSRCASRHLPGQRLIDPADARGPTGRAVELPPDRRWPYMPATEALLLASAGLAVRHSSARSSTSLAGRLGAASTRDVRSRARRWYPGAYRQPVVGRALRVRHVIHTRARSEGCWP